MRIFVLPSDFTGSSHYPIEGKDAHYLTKVLRLQEGSSFTGRAPDGTLWDLTIVSIGKGSCLVSCEKAESTPQAVTDTLPEFRGPFPEIHLYQCMCKGKKMEQIIRQATELGVTRIIPVTSEFCVADISKKETRKVDRYETMVKEAVQQSGSPVVTQIAKPLSIDQVAADWKKRGTALVFHQVAYEEQKTLGAVLARHKETPEAPIAVVIGSEGGFSEREISGLLKLDFIPVLLKTNILRAETAAITVVAIIQQFLVDNL